MPRDCYEILGVARSASAKEIKSAYRSLAMKYHPDRQSGKVSKEIEQKFKEISEAYQILSDPKKRQQYDQFGHQGLEGGFSAGQEFGSFTDVFGDVFSEMFGGSRRHRTGKQGGVGQAGNDLQYKLELDLVQAVQGTKYNLSFKAQSTCGTCNGSGSLSKKAPMACPQCEGMGSLRQTQGLFTVEQTCPGCRGAGMVLQDPCGSCGGMGRFLQNKKLTITVPAGIKDGDRMRLSGEGESGIRGGASGDLYVAVTIKPHSLFSVTNNDLLIEVPIDAITAMVGGEIEVPTFDGMVILKVPSATQNGKTLRISGKGIADSRSRKKGDLLCRVRIETPVRLDKKQLQSLHQISETMDIDSNMPNIRNWRNRIEEFLDVRTD